MALNLIIIILIAILLVLCLYLSKSFFGARNYLFSPIVVAFTYYALKTFPGTIDYALTMNTAKPLLGPFFSILGVVFALILLNAIPKKSKGSVYRTLFFSRPIVIYFFILIGCLSVMFTFLMFGNIPFLSLVKDLMGGGVDVSMHDARRMNTLEHRSGNTTYFGQGYLKVIYLTISPIFICVLYIVKKLKNESTKFVKYLMIMFCIFGALNGQIWPTVNLILLFSLITFSLPYIFNNTNTIPPSPFFLVKKGIKLMLIVLIFIFAYRYAQQMSGRSFDNFFSDTFRRIYYDGPAVLYTLFPDTYDFRNGSTWINDLLGFLPGSSQNFSYEVHYLVHGGGWGYTLYPGLFVSAYVNYGFLGNFFLFSVITMVYCLIYKYLIGTTVIEYRVLAISLSLSLASALSADIASVVLPLIIMLALILAILIIHKFLNTNKAVIKFNEIPNNS